MAHLVELEQELGAVQEALQIAGGAEAPVRDGRPADRTNVNMGRNTGWWQWALSYPTSVGRRLNSLAPSAPQRWKAPQAPMWEDRALRHLWL